VDQTSEGRCRLGQLVLHGEGESVAKSKLATKPGRRHAERGRWGWSAPYGYINGPKNAPKNLPGLVPDAHGNRTWRWRPKSPSHGKGRHRRLLVAGHKFLTSQ
jgi:hypothetical protein